MPPCPTCHAVYHLLVEAEPDVVRRGVEAMARGPGFGVLVGLPEYLGAQTPEEAAALEVAREVGYYAGVASIDELIRIVPEKGHDPEQIARILAQLRRPPPEGQVHVLAVIEGCAATVTARASVEIVAARDADAERIRRIAERLARAEAEVLRRATERAPRAGKVFVVVAPDDAMIARLRVDELTARAAKNRGAYAGLHDVADVIAALPLEGLDADEGVRAATRLSAPAPEGAVRVVAVHDGHITVVTRRPEPGFLAIS
jgi:hypothetical protein